MAALALVYSSDASEDADIPLFLRRASAAAPMEDGPCSEIRVCLQVLWGACRLLFLCAWVALQIEALRAFVWCIDRTLSCRSARGAFGGWFAAGFGMVLIPRVIFMMI